MMIKKTFSGSLLVVAALAFFWGCDSMNPFYSPEPAKARETAQGTDTVAAEGASLYQNNGSIQICNQSISQDTVNYPASMMWLNFDGPQAFTIVEGVTPAGAPAPETFFQQHDHIFVTDTGNALRWWIKVPDSLKEWQDPEWSTHPEYLVSLAKSKTLDTYGIFGIRTSDKGLIQLYDKQLRGDATPHLWVGSTPGAEIQSSGGIAEKTQHITVTNQHLTEFFGTSNVKMVWNEGWNSLFFVDFNEASPVVRQLELPDVSGSGAVAVVNPLISPDGQWVVYHVDYIGQDRVESYVQNLSSGAAPFLITAQTSVADPHWFEASSGDLFLVYSTVTGVLLDDYATLLSTLEADPTFETEKTFLRSIDILSSVPAAARIQLGTPIQLAPLAFKGGLSPDGKWLCTGANRAYLYGDLTK